MKKCALAFVSALLLASCAAEMAAPLEAKEEAVYTTGSNIPRKQTGAVVIDKDELERNRNITNPALRTGKGS